MDTVSIHLSVVMGMRGYESSVVRLICTSVGKTKHVEKILTSNGIRYSVRNMIGE
jgi:hypothetical protein